jgi:hypothetical protein
MLNLYLGALWENPTMKHLTFFLVTLCTVAQAQSRDTGLMTPAEYKSFLNKVEVDLPEWESGLKRVDPAKTEASYAAGKDIIEYRDLALMQVEYVRQSVMKERVRHSISGELALERFLSGVFDQMESVVMTELDAGVTASHLEKYAPEISPLMIQIRFSAFASAEYRPCFQSARCDLCNPATVFGPVLLPPCMRQRPFAIAGHRQGIPRLFFAPHRAVKQAMNPMQSENIPGKIRENQSRSSSALLSRRN